MSIFRQYIAPVLIVIVFLVAIVATSARAFLPSDMAAPAPTEPVDSSSASSQVDRYAQFVTQSEVIGQFFTGQFYLGQFYIQ